MNEEKPRKLNERTIDFGLSAIDYCEKLPRSFTTRHIADQLLRSATSVAANYAEASESESTQDFIRKMKLALKELKESRVWLLFASRINQSAEVEALKQEAQELILMISSSIATAKKRLQ